jgi:hypothetical protein
VTPGDQQCTGFATFVALDYLSQASLNNVYVTIDGAMTIDTTIIAAKIDEVAFDSVAGCGDEHQPCFWSAAAAGGVRKGTITGSYLTGGTVHIVGANDLGITEVNTVTDGSDDQHLHFTFKLSKGVKPGTLNFQVSKPKPGTNATLDSDQRARSVSYQAVAPSVTKVEQNVKDNKLTIKGANFLDNAPLPLVVTLTSAGGDHVTLDSSKFTIKSAEQIELDIPSEADAVGCWTLRVDTSPSINPAAANNNFVVMPTVESATLDGDVITVVGTALDAHDCDGKLPSFKLLNGTKTFTPTRENTSTATEVKLKLPSAAKGADATWKLQVQFGGKDLKDTPVALTLKAK